MSSYGTGVFSAIPYGTGNEGTTELKFELFSGANLKRLDAIEFRVTNPAWEFTADINLVFSTGEVEQAWVGEGFAERYWRGSARIPIDGAFHYILRRTGGWPGRLVDIDVTATDFAGNVVSGHSS